MGGANELILQIHVSLNFAYSRSNLTVGIAWCLLTFHGIAYAPPNKPQMCLISLEKCGLWNKVYTSGASSSYLQYPILSGSSST